MHCQWALTRRDFPKTSGPLLRWFRYCQRKITQMSPKNTNPRFSWTTWETQRLVLKLCAGLAQTWKLLPLRPSRWCEHVLCLLVLGQANSSNRRKEPSWIAVLYSSWRSIKTDIRTGMVMRNLITWELSVRVWQDEWVRVCVLRQKEVRNFFCEMTKNYLLGIQD